MKKENNFEKMEKMVDVESRCDGTLDFLYFRLKFAIGVIENFKKLYKYSGIIKRYTHGKEKYSKATDILDEVMKILESNKGHLTFKNMDFIKSVELYKDDMVKFFSTSKPHSFKDKKFIKKINNVTNELHFELGLSDKEI